LVAPSNSAGFRPDLALDLRVDEILLDVFVMPSLANDFMLDRNHPIVQKFPRSLDREEDR
jgi:hypothetical protein